MGNQSTAQQRATSALGRPPIDALPLEVLSKIFSYDDIFSPYMRLRVLSLVCKTWRRAALLSIRRLAWSISSWQSQSRRIVGLASFAMLLPSLKELSLLSRLNMIGVVGSF